MRVLTIAGVHSTLAKDSVRGLLGGLRERTRARAGTGTAGSSWMAAAWPAAPAPWPCTAAPAPLPPPSSWRVGVPWASWATAAGRRAAAVVPRYRWPRARGADGEPTYSLRLGPAGQPKGQEQQRCCIASSSVCRERVAQSAGNQGLVWWRSQARMVLVWKGLTARLLQCTARAICAQMVYAGSRSE